MQPFKVSYHPHNSTSFNYHYIIVMEIIKRLSPISRIACSLLVLILSAPSSFAQSKMTCIDSLLMNPEYKSLEPAIQQMRKEGMTDRNIFNSLEADAKKRRKEMLQSSRGVDLTLNNKGGKTNASCTAEDLGLTTNSFGSWTAQTSCRSSVPSNCTATPWVPATLPLPGRIDVVPTSPNDPCGDVPGSPIPLPSPYGGSFSIKLGNNDINAESERLKYTFTVQPSDIDFVYQYAVVLENPAGHLPSEQPYFDFVILDKDGDTIPCSYQHYVAAPGLPGFNTSLLSNPACNSISATVPSSAVYYTTWTLVGVNLSSYVGQPVTVVCTTGDCSRCGHFGYTYLDFSCGALSTSQFCVGSDSVLLAAPYDPTFSYSWSTGETTSSIIVNPQLTTSVTVSITQTTSTCGFNFQFILIPTTITPAFTDSVDCATGSVYFSDNTGIIGGTISSWDWQFPGGTPSSSTAQNPGPISYPPGTYTVSLMVTSQAGCKSTLITQTINIGPLPDAQFTFTGKLSCDGLNVQFTDASTNAISWYWNFGDDSTSTLQNPTHLFPFSSTPYSVTLYVGKPPCRDSITQLVSAGALFTLINPNVFTPNGDGVNDCFRPIFSVPNLRDTLAICITMEIFDRWGIKVFESNGGSNVCWDGKTMTNGKARDGTYYYIVGLGKETFHGFVELLRHKK